MQPGIRRVFAVLVAVLLMAGLFAQPAHQPVRAGGSWSAWIYNSDTGVMAHVFPDGVAPVQWSFPLPPGTSAYPSAVTVSRDGAYLAACLIDDMGTTSVRVYDIYSAIYTAAYIVTGGPVPGCSLSRYSFSENGSQVAFGILNKFYDPADPRPDWELVVMDTHSSVILYRIASDTPAMLALGIPSEGRLPFISTFQMATASFPGLISFKPVMWGTEGAPEYDSVIWQLNGETLNMGGPYGKASLDVLLPNSEAIWVDSDPAFPLGTLEGPGFLYNVVMYSNKAGDRYAIYTDRAVLYSTVFIDDGRKVAVHSYTSPGPERWLWVSRDGSVGMLPAAGEAWELYGTLDGYVYLNNHSLDGTAPDVRYGRFTGGGAGPEESIAWTGTPGEYWRMVWVNPLSGGAGLPPFPAITPAPGPVPTPLPPGGVLIAGGRAQVHTTAGDMLRVRSGPGTGYGVTFQLANGTPVTLLEGPTTGGGLTWWYIRTDDGRTGWAVEGVMDGGAYLQTLVPMP